MIGKKVLSIILSLLTVISLVPLFATGASASLLEQSDPLVKRVAQYCMELDRGVVNQVRSFDLSNVDEYNKYVSLMNLINKSKKESRDLFALAGDDNFSIGDGFAAHSLRKGMKDNLVLRSTLGLSGLIFNDELVGWIAGENADVEKYKSALKSFMSEQESRIKLFLTVKTANSYLKALSQTVDTAKATELIQEIQLAIYQSKSAEDVSALLKASELERVLNGSETIEATSQLTEVFDAAGKVLTITAITGEGIEKIANVEANFEIFKEYEDFLNDIINDKSLPSNLRIAAKQVYPDINNLYCEAIMSFKNAIEKYGVKKGIKLSAKAITEAGASAAISDFLGAYGVGKVLVGHLFSAKDIVKGCAAIECYDMLAEKYAKAVLKDKAAFNSNPTLENAQKFQADYDYLQQLRLSGEKKYLEMVGFDKSWDPIQRSVMRTVTGYKENKSFLKNNIEMIEAAEFSMEDDDETYNLKIREFYDTTADVQCPVNVKVYDKNNVLVASVVNNEIQDIDADSADFPVVVYTEGDEKIVRMVSSNDYRIEIEACGSGEMTYTSTKKTAYDELVYETSYEKMKITSGDTFAAEPEEDTDVISRSLYKTTGSEPKKVKPTNDYDNRLLPNDESDVAEVVVAEELFDGFSTELIDKVAKAMFSYSANVDISSFNISTKDTVALFSAIAKYYPSEYSILSRSDFTYRIVYSPSRKIITGIRFYYDNTLSSDAYQRRVKETNAAIESLVAKTKGMNDFEKALYVHDYIILNCEYDLDLLNLIKAEGTLDGEVYSERYTEYSVLVNGTGICGSYALAYRAVMNACGVECLYLSSKAMNHAWNMIKLDGKWYHVDCCWDDPTPDRYGEARRTYFLRTDDEIMELNHYSWTPNEYKATSSKYSAMPRYADTVQKYENGSWYFLESGSLYKTDSCGNKKSLVSPVTATTFDVEDGEIYYSYGREIYDLNEKSGASTLSYYLPDNVSGTSREYTYLRNLYVDGDSVTTYRGIYQENEYEYIKNTQENILGTVDGIKLNHSSLTLGFLETQQLVLTLSQGDDVCTIDKPLLVADDDSVAALRSGGKITGKHNGTMNVTAYFGGMSASCAVTVSFDVDTTDKIQYLDYEIKNGEVTITDCDESITGELVIPSEIEGYPVTRIGSNHSFFNNCAGLTSINIPASVTCIPFNVFSNCTGLTRIDVDENNTVYDSRDNCNAIIETATNTLISGCENTVIPNSVTIIGWGAFDSCIGLTSITIPDSVTSIEGYAFSDCTGLTSIIIPDSVTSIKGDAFFGCTGLTSITIPDGVTSIEYEVFCCCTGLTSITIPDSVTSIAYHAFENCTSLTNINIPNSVTTIYDYAFYGCTSLTSITIPDSVTSIDEVAFFRCSGLTSIAVDENNTVYDSRNNCNAIIETATNTLISGCKNTVITNSVTSIGDNAFYGCTGLTSIILSNSVISIGDDAFGGCSGLISIVVDENNTVYDSRNNCNAIIETATNKLISGCKNTVIPDSVTSIGNNAFDGCTGLTSINIPDGITRIGDHAFSRCTSLTKFKIPDSVTYIDWCAFYYCTGLTTITIPNGVTSINPGTFSGCSSLKSVTIPDSVTRIAGLAFDGCTGLTDVYYTGSEEQWNKIEFYEDNEPLLNATIHYNYVPHEHSYTAELTKVATCTEDGVMTYTCSCGDSYTETVKAKGHSYKLVSSSPSTCFEPSVSKYKCENCGNEITVTGKETDKHKYVIAIHGATCTDVGYTEGTCSECHDSVMYDFVSPLGHDLTITRTPATCKEHSEVEYSCSRCDYREIVIDTDSSLAEHSYKKSVTAPTCTEQGFTKYTCSVCGDCYTSDNVPAKGHTDGEWKVTKQPTTKAEGEKSLFCKDCGKVIKTESIPKLKPTGKVNSVKIDDITLNYKASATIKPTIKADDGVKYTVKYSSSNTKVATVDKNGKVYAAKRGTATITCTVTDSDGNTVQDTCKVTVKYTWWQWIIKIVLGGWAWYSL